MSIRTNRFFQNTLGMNLRFTDISIDPREAEEITNLHATTDGSWTSNSIGYMAINDTAIESGSTITSLYEYVSLNGTSYVIAAAADKWFTVETGSGALNELTGGLSNGLAFDFVTFNGLLIGCNGIDSPMKWDGVSSVTTLGGWAPVIAGITPGNPSLCATYVNRVVLSGDSDNPSMIYLSEQEAPENFTPDGTGDATSAGAIQISPGDGQKITALKSMFLPLTNEEVLIIFKERSTFMLTGSDAGTFAIQKLSDEFGAVSAKSVVQVGNQLMFLTEEGMTALSTATLQGNITSTFISDKIRPQINSLNRNLLNRSFAVHLRSRQEVWWVAADGSALENNLVLVYNYGMQQAWSRRIGIMSACGLVSNGNLYTGSYDGFIHAQMRGNTYNGDAIAWTYKSPFYDLSAPRNRKRVRDIELFIKQLTQMDVTVKTAWDFKRGSSSRQSTTLSVTPDQSSAVYGIAVYGSDDYDVAGLSVLRFTPPGSGKFFQMELSGSEAGKPVEIQGWMITAIYGGLE